MHTLVSSFFFFFNDTATTEIYTLSLHDALPISLKLWGSEDVAGQSLAVEWMQATPGLPYLKALKAYGDRKSTRLNSSHLVISYAVFCLKKKNKNRRSDNHEVQDAPRTG